MKNLALNSIVSNSLFVGKVAWHYPTIDSTNSAAVDLLSKSNPTEGTVIYADHQTAGRGQIGSRWESPPGQNLLLSIILYPKFLLATQQFKLHQVVSLALFELLQAYLYDREALAIKWPNDLYYNDQKLGGILIENSLQGSHIRHTVVGIGLNINQTAFAPELSRATSLRSITGQWYELPLLLSALCQQIEYHYLALKNQRYQALEQAYRQRLYGYQRWRTFQRLPQGDRFRGKIIGITPQGLLQVKTAQEVETYDMKAIRFAWD